MRVLGGLDLLFKFRAWGGFLGLRLLFLPGGGGGGGGGRVAWEATGALLHDGFIWLLTV